MEFVSVREPYPTIVKNEIYVSFIYTDVFTTPILFIYPIGFRSEIATYLRYQIINTGTLNVYIFFPNYITSRQNKYKQGVIQTRIKN